MSATDLSPEEIVELRALHKAATKGTHYDLFDVPGRAEPDAIQQRYYDLSRKWHPDRFFRRELGPHADALETVFIAITEAYRILSNAGQRLSYDQQLGRDETPLRTPPAGAPAAVEHTVDGPARRTPSAAPKRASPARRARRRSRSEELALGQMRKQLKARLRKARKYFEEGKEALDAGQVMRACSSLELAATYAPRNEEYKKLAKTARLAARKAQSSTFIAAAENAESFANPREAIANYQKAIEYGTDDGRAFFRLAMLMKRYGEGDSRDLLNLLRLSVQHMPDNIEFRLALGDLYNELDLKLNARREFQAVLDRKKDHKGAKEGLRRSR